MFVYFARRRIICPEHGLPGSARNHLCPLSFGYVWSVSSVLSQGRALPAESGSAPCPRVPGHGGIQGAGVSGVSVVRSVSRLLKGGGGGVARLVEPGIGFGTRSVRFGSVQVSQVCVKCGSCTSVRHFSTTPIRTRMECITQVLRLLSIYF